MRPGAGYKKLCSSLDPLAEIQLMKAIVPLVFLALLEASAPAGEGQRFALLWDRATKPLPPANVSRLEQGNDPAAPTVVMADPPLRVAKGEVVAFRIRQLQNDAPSATLFSCRVGVGGSEVSWLSSGRPIDSNLIRQLPNP